MKLQRITENYPLGLMLATIFVFLPIVNWLSLTWATLMILRREWYVGLGSIGLMGFLCVFVFHGFQFQLSLSDMSALVGLIGPLWLMAYSLQRLRSLSLSLQLGAFFVFIIALLGYLIAGPMSYQNLLDALSMQMFGADAKISTLQTMYLEVVTTFLLYAWPAMLWLTQATVLLFARYLQSKWYNPDGFQHEFHQLRLSRLLLIVLLFSMVWAFMNKDNQLAMQAMILFSTVFSLAGVAFVHWYVKFRQMGKGWLFAMYLLIALLTTWVLPLFVLLGALDTQLHLRQRFQDKTQ